MIEPVRFEIIGKPRSQKNNKQIVWYKDRPTGRPTSALVDSPQVKKWRKQALPQLKGQWLNRDPLEGNLAAIVTSYLGSRQRSDADNLLAGPLDALQNAGIVKDDRIFDSVVSIRLRDHDNPRSEIIICPNDWLEIAIRRPGEQ